MFWGKILNIRQVRYNLIYICRYVVKLQFMLCIVMVKIWSLKTCLSIVFKLHVFQSYLNSSFLKKWNSSFFCIKFYEICDGWLIFYILFHCLFLSLCLLSFCINKCTCIWNKSCKLNIWNCVICNDSWESWIRKPLEKLWTWLSIVQKNWKVVYMWVVNISMCAATMVIYRRYPFSLFIKLKGRHPSQSMFDYKYIHQKSYTRIMAAFWWNTYCKRLVTLYYV